ncbi:MmgE/PrpD family protein [Franzmannia qiaohouensis]|uniref:MmgE/PrpD family protein n=1 Tax=Franzmannia qiaohouensis TaxID=1329370 RepID=A0ABU1HE59_9GAMM|nr:MmgE/PrpD family protein [Halomonas qiaohouensis]MDR5905750.1 MmgE/PrpD family protein [Halomonas qiaohouensis]
MHDSDTNFAPLDWILDVDLDALGDTHLVQAKRALLDTLGVAAGASRTALARHAERYVISQHGGGRPLLFSTATASASGVALHGAWMIDALDAHDGQVLTKGHCGVALVPGILALPEVEKLSGRALLGLLAMGYEVATRAGIALHASACDYHTSGAWNAIGVAAVAAKLLRLDRARLHEALGIAEFYGPRSQMMRCIDHPTMVKDGSGWGAQAGIAAALLAQDGFTGAPAVTVTGSDVTQHWQDLGSRWYLHEQYFKAYPVCRWAQPAVEAVLALARQSVDIDAIERISIATFHEAKQLHVVHPTTTEQAQYSLPWSVACALGFGTIDVHAVSDALDDPLIKALAQRVELVESETFNARFPAERWAQATLIMHDGSQHRSQPHEARGNPHNPLSDEELTQKFHALATPAIGQAHATELHEVIMTLEERSTKHLLERL